MERGHRVDSAKRGRKAKKGEAAEGDDRGKTASEGAFWEERSLGGAAALILVVGLWLSPDRGFGGFLPCPWLQATGLPCPFCGLTRSVSAFLRGEWGRSWDLHPFGMAVVLACLLLFLGSLGPHVWRPKLRFWLGSPVARAWLSVVVGLLAGFFLGVWLLRVAGCLAGSPCLPKV